MNPPSELPPNAPLTSSFSHHFEDASFLWTLRSRAVETPPLRLRGPGATGRAHRSVPGWATHCRCLCGVRHQRGPRRWRGRERFPSPLRTARTRRFHPEPRYLLGPPMTVASLRGALALGRQRERRAAALELAMRHPGQPLLDVGANVRRMRRRRLARLRALPAPPLWERGRGADRLPARQS